MITVKCLNTLPLETTDSLRLPIVVDSFSILLSALPMLSQQTTARAVISQHYNKGSQCSILIQCLLSFLLICSTFLLQQRYEPFFSHCCQDHDIDSPFPASPHSIVQPWRSSCQCVVKGFGCSIVQWVWPKDSRIRAETSAKLERKGQPTAHVMCREATYMGTEELKTWQWSR